MSTAYFDDAFNTTVMSTKVVIEIMKHTHIIMITTGNKDHFIFEIIPKQ